MAETLTVTQLNTRVSSLLKDSPAVRDIWVVGEISNLTCHSSGHYYFTLKDEGSEIRSVLFRNSRGRIDFEPQENMKVTAFGRVDLYVPRGNYQFIVETMRRSGIGDLYLQFEKLKKKLEAEGLFERSRKRKLPTYPKTVGVVTSETGAVIHDIVVTSGNLFPADILLAPAKVQGDGAAESIIKGIDLLNRADVDVIIVGRGGGSIEDLWAFNEEKVARAIVSSRVPIISAVGHESDITIADLVADVRAPTPTGAAEIALPDGRELIKHIDGMGARANRALLHITEKMRHRIDLMDSKLDPERRLESLGMLEIRMEQLSSRADSALRSIVHEMRSRFNSVESKISTAAAMRTVESMKETTESISGRLTIAIDRRIRDALSTADSLDKRIEALNPLKVLERGYSYVTDSEGRTLTSAKALQEGSMIGIRFRDGSAEAEVRKVKDNE
ncbi:MAG TPA: exodeoxyribonuclease VII large subunit [Candidatus Methanomethylophilaceae archaeon]|nr:exodeoxyribonuclease VII large subunit [Candidatus Methanomethylophilaceae archaeon]